MKDVFKCTGIRFAVLQLCYCAIKLFIALFHMLDRVPYSQRGRVCINSLISQFCSISMLVLSILPSKKHFWMVQCQNVHITFMFTADVLTTATTADIISADTAQTVPYTVYQYITNVLSINTIFKFHIQYTKSKSPKLQVHCRVPDLLT